MATLSHEQTRRVYDRIGAWQDTQAFYEDRATALVVAHGDFDTATRVFEFGCGTGRFAARLMAEHLPATAQYRGVDLSPTMIALARARLASFGSRADVVQTDGAPPAAERTGSCDRFVSNFVLDLLPEDDIAAVVREAHRMLVPGGVLGLASLSSGDMWPTRLVARLWSGVHRVVPALVGGCRPLDLRAWVPARDWTIRHHVHLAPFGLPSEVVVAERR
jgi:SAM-dependent methyltransferase